MRELAVTEHQQNKCNPPPPLTPIVSQTGPGSMPCAISSFVRKTGIKMGVQGSIQQFTQHREEALCQVFLLLINMAID